MHLSVVIPTLNEATELPDTLRRVRAVPEVSEVIVVDGGSSDATCEIAEAAGAAVRSGPRGRGAQLRLGASEARGEVMLLLHADTWLPPDAGRAVLQSFRDPRVVGGGFWKVFRDPHWAMRGSRFRCWWRWRALGRVMFVRREILECIGGVPDVPLMEEFILCRRLRRVGRLRLADAVVSTSSRRWRERGVWRTYGRMWRVTFGYYAGRSPEELCRMYERRGG
jgi:rSAM/selenodomain-associated transferase 2